MRLRRIAGTRNLVGPIGVSLGPSVEVGLGGQVVRLLEIAALMRGDKVVRELHRVSQEVRVVLPNEVDPCAPDQVEDQRVEAAEAEGDAGVQPDEGRILQASGLRSKPGWGPAFDGGLGDPARATRER